MKQKRIYIILLALWFFACSDEEPVKTGTLATPGLNWHSSALYNDMLLISVTIESNKALPSGLLHFQTNGLVSRKFLPLRGEQKLLTGFRFDNYEVQQVDLIYRFDDNRESIITSYALQKVPLEVKEYSVDANWTDYKNFRFGEKASIAILVGFPSISSATSFPVPGPRVQPNMAWPAAMVRLEHPLGRPM